MGPARARSSALTLTLAPPAPPPRHLAQPFFGPLVSLVGSITYYPLAVLFPSLMWVKVRLVGLPIYFRCGQAAGLAVALPSLASLGPRGALFARGRLQDVVWAQRRHLLSHPPTRLHPPTHPLPLCSPTCHPPPPLLQVYQPTGRHLLAIKLLCASMALVAALAVVGAARGLVVSWSKGFVLFAD